MIDVLSDVLRAVRLTGAAYFDFTLTSPWVAEAPPSREIAGLVMPGAERVIEFHVIANGACWGHAIGDSPIRLGAGDLIIFPQGDSHVLSSQPGMRGPDNFATFVRKAEPLPLAYRVGGGGSETAHILCCFLGCDERPYNPLLGALPRTLHLPASDAGAARLHSLMAMAMTEAHDRSAGAQNVLARLSELMFVEAVRRYLATLADVGHGWLAGLRDPIVGAALAAIHSRPSDPWTVERLAHEAGASRSVFAERFAAMTGQPPMQYVALWRMQLASRRLVDGDPVAAVADAVGYESEAAFSRAFKKIVGASPAAWRTARTAAGAAL